LVEAVRGRPLVEAEWTAVQEIGALIGWQPEALRLAAIEGREVGWEGALGESRGGRLPWAALRRRLLDQQTRLEVEQQGWLAALVAGTVPGDWLTDADTARLWEVETADAKRRLWTLRWQGLADEGPDAAHWRIAPVMRLALDRDGQQRETGGSERQ
jgi:hypothetical protein